MTYGQAVQVLHQLLYFCRMSCVEAGVVGGATVRYLVIPSYVIILFSSPS